MPRPSPPAALTCSSRARSSFGEPLGDGKTFDAFPSKKFDYMLANPPFGVKWEPEEDNQRFGTDFTPNDELFWDQVRDDATADETVRSAGEANTRDNFAYVFDRKLEELVINRMDRNSSQAVRFLDNPEIRGVITRLIRDQVYDRIQDQSKARAASI